MTLFLRNQENRSIVDIEINFADRTNDLHSAVNIEFYSRLLRENIHRAEEVISDFKEIDELRAWFWEVYMEIEPEPNLKNCVNQIRELLIKIADKYNLNYVED